MSEDVANRLGIEDPWRYIRLDDAKQNHTAPDKSANWRKLVSVEEEGHEHSVVAMEYWEFPEEMDEQEEDSGTSESAKTKREIEMESNFDRVLAALRNFMKANGYDKVPGRWGFTKAAFTEATKDVFVGPRAARDRSDIKKLMLRYDLLAEERRGVVMIVDPPEPAKLVPSVDDLL
jgi:hypothetical protein